MKSLNGEAIKNVLDFKYLGSYIASTDNDVSIRIGKAWAVLNNLNKIWTSNLSIRLKETFSEPQLNLYWYMGVPVNSDQVNSDHF